MNWISKFYNAKADALALMAGPALPGLIFSWFDLEQTMEGTCSIPCVSITTPRTHLFDLFANEFFKPSASQLCLRYSNRVIDVYGMAALLGS